MSAPWEMLPWLDLLLLQHGLSVSTRSLPTEVLLKVGGREKRWPCFLPRDTIAFGEAVQAVYVAGLSFFRNYQARNNNAAAWQKQRTA